MCGLVAYYKTSDRPIAPSLIEDMTQVMEHRGPDDYSYCFVARNGPVVWRDGHRPPPLAEPGVAMGHRRYSIFDLSGAGRQPFFSSDKRYTMVFNGEIYNYVELRDELTKHGFEFSTNCDTEVLLAAYEKWGTECLGKLNGCWAMAIWDNVSKELVVARDRFGEKPLFYTEIDGDLVFASEVKALLMDPRISAIPDERSVIRFIAAGASPLTGDTFFERIKCLEPGTFLRIRKGHVSETRYWDLDSMDLTPRTDERQAIEELRELLTDAVRMRLRGDLRVGTLLSGGVDSTSVISSIATVLEGRLDEGRSIGDQLHAFTASFPGLANDETSKVEEFCRSIEINCHKVFPIEQDSLDHRLGVVSRKLEAPFWSPAIVVHDMLMGMVKSTDVGIVLDGTASDEIFGGYDWYLPLAVKDNLRGLRFATAAENLNGLQTLLGRSRVKEVARSLLPRRLPEHLDGLGRLLQGKGLHWYSGLLEKELCRRDAKRPRTGGATMLDRAMKDALLRDNIPRWLHMGDNISMSHSICIRSPFLDYRLVEFGFSLDNKIKIRKGMTKYVLREAKRDQLPASILDDFRKVQFSGPATQWLNGPLKEMALSLKKWGWCAGA